VSRRARDDAHLRHDELAELDGVRRPPARRTGSTRVVVWSITTVACVLVFAFALTQREQAPPPAPVLPTVLYGDALPTSTFGSDAVCTEYELQRGGGWRCDSVLLNSSHVPVYPAARYSGPCAHLKVVERSWVCLGNAPAPSEPAPTAPTVNS
jgi:hypothetical protein